MVGIGIDIANITRFEKYVADRNKAARIFTETEICYALGKHDPAQSFAAAFAAREAAFKAICAWVPQCTAQDFSLEHCQNGAPMIVLRPKAASKLQNFCYHISVTHDAGVAVAVCVAEKKEDI